jgi:hypothetical protein
MATQKKAVKKKDDEEQIVVGGLGDFLGDPDKEEEGVWFSLNDATGREFLVAHAENSNFQSKLTRIMKPHMARLRKRDSRAVRLQRRLTGIAMAGTVLKNWKGGDLDSTPFDEKLGEKVLIDPHYRRFRSQIEEWAEMDEAYIEDAIEEASKN